jgi:hypothetical protein
MVVSSFVLTGCGGQTLTAEDYNKHGLSLAGQGKYDSAVKEYTKAIKLAPQNADYYVNRGDAYYDMEEYDLAIADYTKAIELDPENASARLYSSRGVSYVLMGKYNLAIADFTKVIELDPNNGASYIARGIAYRANGQLDLAIADFTIAIELSTDPEDIAFAKKKLEEINNILVTPPPLDGVEENGEGGSLFTGDWESPYPCKYYELSDEDRQGEVTANFYLHIGYYDGFLAGSNWIGAVSRQLVPGADEFFVWSVLVPLADKPGYYLGPLDFNTRPFPGEEPETTVAISGNTMTVDTLVVGNYTQRIAFTLVSNDSRFKGKDTLYVTLTFIRHTDNWIFPNESDPNAIVLVRK